MKAHDASSLNALLQEVCTAHGFTPAESRPFVDTEAGPIWQTYARPRSWSTLDPATIFSPTEALVDPGPQSNMDHDVLKRHIECLSECDAVARAYNDRLKPNNPHGGQPA